MTNDVVDVDFSSHPFKVTPLNGEPVEALTVIIATGARANYLGLDSEERFKNMGVSACAVCDGAMPRFRNQPLVVVGGGDSAMEEGTFLTKFASKVYLVHRRLQRHHPCSCRFGMVFSEDINLVIGIDLALQKLVLGV